MSINNLTGALTDDIFPNSKMMFFNFNFREWRPSLLQQLQGLEETMTNMTLFQHQDDRMALGARKFA